MKLDAGEIEQLVTETERKRAPWARAACVWEDDWYGALYEDTRRDHQEQDGVDVVVSPDAYNIVQLLLRFVAGEQRVEVPSLSPKEDDEDRSETMEEWLVAFDQESNRQQGRNHINDMTVQSGVLARGATQILWVGDVLKKQKITNRLPILRRSLDPRNVGVGRGAFGVDYGYHTYEATQNYIKQMYPSYEFSERDTDDKVRDLLKKQYKVIDYYYRHSGTIWHGVVVDHKFAKDPVHTEYPEIPIIEHRADGGPFDDELGQSMSILHPVHELIKMKSDIMSKVATGLMYHYDPLMIAKNFGPDDKIKAGPGEIIYLREDQSLDMFRPEPNVPMAQALLTMIQQGIDQATFPGVTFGDGGAGQSGYAINSLQQPARQRVSVIRQNIEAAMEAQNQLVLGLIEAFVPDEGVEIYGRSARGDRGKALRLTKKIIKGNYANSVILVPEQPMDDAQRILAYTGLIDKGVMSKSTFRNRVLNMPVPRDEELRVAAERAEQSPQMQLKASMRALQKTHDKSEWEMLFLGTEFEQMHQQEQQWREQKAAEAEQAKAQKEAEKEAQRQQELMTASMGPMPPLPPMGPEMMGGSMPPLPPPSGQMPPMGLPGEPPMSMQPPGLPGVPPAMAGQFDPNSLGLQGAPSGTMDMMMGGQPPSEEEMLRGMLPPQF